ncbi:MAG: 2-oxoacid:ferredoxin oxidoreductase subunit beta, partial [Bacteroidetes bacterium 4484_276]
KVVKLGENGITEKDLLVHDAHQANPIIHLLLGDMNYPDYPVALGVIRSVDAPVYEESLLEQIEKVKSSSPIKNFKELLYSGNTWEV